MTKAYEEIVDFIATRIGRDELARWTPSQESRDRVWDLLRREKAGGLSGDERTELDHYMELEHLMRLAKAKSLGKNGS